jgi:hypothetical protein
VFSIRTGVNVPTAFGLLGTNGIVDLSWNVVNGIVPGPATTGLFALARATLHAAEFETAFHNQTSNDLSKYSTGAYINPDATNQTLAGFSKISQAQTRTAAIYGRVNTWANAASGNYNNGVVVADEDVDLDGEHDTGYVSQVGGNFASYAGSETEDEGAGNFVSGAVNAYRTSGFKDWFVKTNTVPAGTFTYVNDVYTPTSVTNGWKFTSSDGKIAKTITLAPRKSALNASYATTNVTQMFVRSGLSPDLLDLMTAGQSHLSILQSSASEANLFNNAPARTVRGYLRFGGSGFSGATFNASANDSDALVLDTVAMRNQAQTQQVELQSNGTMNFALGFETGAALTFDTDGDGLPDWWETKYEIDPNNPNGINGANVDLDGDGKTNLQEYILGTNPKVPDSANAALKIVRTSSTTVKLSFGSIRDRIYRVSYSSAPAGPWLPAGADIFGTGSTIDYIDNGTDTGSPPSSGARFYKLEVSLVP